MVSQPSTSGMPCKHVQALTTLTYKRRVNDQVEKLNPNQVESKEDVVNPKNQDNLTEGRVVTSSPSESKFSDMSERSFIPRAPIPPTIVSRQKNFNEIIDMFKRFKINISLLDAIKQIPAYAKFLKDLRT